MEIMYACVYICIYLSSMSMSTFTNRPLVDSMEDSNLLFKKCCSSPPVQCVLAGIACDCMQQKLDYSENTKWLYFSRVIRTPRTVSLRLAPLLHVVPMFSFPVLSVFLSSI